MSPGERQRVNDAWFAAIAATVAVIALFCWGHPGPQTAWWAPVFWWVVIFCVARAARRRDRIDDRKRELRDRFAYGESDVYPP